MVLSTDNKVLLTDNMILSADSLVFSTDNMVLSADIIVLSADNKILQSLPPPKKKISQLRTFLHVAVGGDLWAISGW
jgi:hypothetical protein